MKTLFLRAVDVWMFRDGHPFDAGSGHRAESLFPPYPSVIQGAIRTYRMIHENIKQEDVATTLGTAEDYLDLQIRGPFIAKLENGKAVRYYPQPADAILVGDSMLKPASLTPLEEIQSHVRVSNSMPYLIGYQDMLVNEEKEGADTGNKKKHKESLWISETALEEYHKGIAIEGTPESELFVRENRFGIGINNDSRVVKEGMLYEAQFIRPCKDIGLLIEIGGSGYESFPNNGTMQLGGESRSVWFETVKVEPLPTSKKGTKGYKVYFLTPAYFKDGWQTDWKTLFGNTVELKAAAIGRYESLGGFNRAKNNHKPAYRYVPAGSVYYFECKEEINISQLTDKYEQIGFGQVILKEW